MGIKKHAINNKEYCQIFDNGKIKTIFTSNHRLSGINLEDPRIAEGLRVSLEATRLLKKRSKQANTEFAVMLIPTKELVFKDIVYAESTEISQAYKDLIKNEELVWEKTKEFLKNQKIYFIDTLPILRYSIKSGLQPYLISNNGHPNPIGHYAIANLVSHEIKKAGLLEKDEGAK